MTALAGLPTYLEFGYVMGLSKAIRESAEDSFKRSGLVRLRDGDGSDIAESCRRPGYQ